MTQQVDPITLEVMRNAFGSIADEMTAALVRTGYSTNIKDRRDCSCAIYTAAGEVVALSELNTPVHLGTMHPTVQTILQTFPVSSLEPGDAVMMNMPYPAGPGHLNDVAIMSPVFVGGELVALIANQAHHVDMGGFAPGSMPFGVTEIYQVGLQIPPVKVRRRGVIDNDIVSLVGQNVRTWFEVRGDLMAQMAANNVGEKRLQELVEKYGFETVGVYLHELLDYAERRMRRAISQIPPGRYTFEDYLEGDSISNRRIRIVVVIDVEADRIRFDFSGTDDMVQGPINCRWPSVAACVNFVVKCITDQDMPPNAGSYRPLEIVTREGSLLGAIYPAAVCNANLVLTQRIADVLFGAFLQAVPERVIAACSGTMNLLNIGGPNPRLGRYFSYVETYGGGQGALHCQDGMDGVQNHMTNTRNAPVEVIESAYPLQVERYGLVPDSEGAGCYRGGMGMVREIRILSPSAGVTLSSDRAEIGPWGVFGGKSGRPSNCSVIQPDGTEHRYGSKFTITIQKGDVIRTVTPGGGGWGDPLERDPEKVRWDVLEGLVSVERAASAYGVVIDPKNMLVQCRETQELRQRLRA
jgi:N-methylhydantoinase B